MDEHQIPRVKSHILVNLLSKQYSSSDFQHELHEEFVKTGYVTLPDFFNEETFLYFREEINYLEQYSKNFDFITDDHKTPRAMNTLGALKILSEAPAIWSLYWHYDLRNLIRNIVGTEIYPSLHPTEYMVINYLLNVGSTHGWHLDDIPYGLIIFFDAPAIEDGGLVEFIPNWHEFCASQGASPDEEVDALVEKARDLNLVQVRHHRSGDAYLLQADRCLHRVTGLKRQGPRRAVFNLGFEASPGRLYDDSAFSQMYSES